mmetsp:Transcript_58493/g.167889  ORF Transcript_58493/g.167889 Transcript_58493/m.167889 type:complete len:399 (-) Transcript_58493:12-1208(-)
MAAADPAALKEPEGDAPTVRMETSAGTIDIIIRPDWSARGARRFLELVVSGDLDGLCFYRVIRGCLAQFGLPTKRNWPAIPDDFPTAVPFLLGAVAFAAEGENSRRSTLFICTGDMSECFGWHPWETPLGAVAEASLGVLAGIETAYGDVAECGGAGPDTPRLRGEGPAYLDASFPLLTRIHSARLLDFSGGGGGGEGSPLMKSIELQLSRQRASEPEVDLSWLADAAPAPAQAAPTGPSSCGRRWAPAAPVVATPSAPRAALVAPSPSRPRRQQPPTLVPVPVSPVGGAGRHAASPQPTWQPQSQAYPHDRHSMHVHSLPMGAPMLSAHRGAPGWAVPGLSAGPSAPSTQMTAVGVAPLASAACTGPRAGTIDGRLTPPGRLPQAPGWNHPTPWALR